MLDATECGTDGTQVGVDTFNTTTGAGSFDCTFPDGPASSTVSVHGQRLRRRLRHATRSTVTVTNVKPSIVLTGDATADEGSTHTYSYTVTDPGQDTHTITTACGANGAKVAGSDTYNAGTGLGSFQCFFADGPATTNVTATVTDSDGASDTDNQVVVVTVNNVAPTVTLVGRQRPVGQRGHQPHLQLHDQRSGRRTTFALVSTDCGANGTQVGAATFNTDDGCGQFRLHVPRRPGQLDIVSVQVKDSDGANSNTATQTVTVNNVAPTVTLSAGNDLSVNEGTTHTYSFTITDPGADTFMLGAVRAAAPTAPRSGRHVNTDHGAGSFVCTFPDGPASTVSVTVKDSDGAASNTDTQTVTVANVAPTVTVSGNDLSVERGHDAHLQLHGHRSGRRHPDGHRERAGQGADYVADAAAGSFQLLLPGRAGSSTVNVTADDGDSDNAREATPPRSRSLTSLRRSPCRAATSR